MTIKIAVDVMGADNPPSVLIEGVINAVNKFSDIMIFLVGKQEIINEKLSALEYPENSIEVVNSSQIIEMSESPSKALRQKKDSSIYIGSQLVAEGEAEAFVSPGNTGAVMAAGLFNIGRISGIKRPAIVTLFPSEGGRTLVLDSGANTDSTPENLLQFALMGQIYAHLILNKTEARIGLLSIGEEKSKGNKLTSETYDLLEQDPRIKKFIGNIEGRDVFSDKCDIAVCDGFTGNIVLKTTEGTAFFLLDMFKKAFKKNLITKFAALIMKSQLKEIKNKVDYRQYGGAPLLGVKGVVIISHGSSDKTAIYNAVLAARRNVKNDIVREINDIINREGEGNEQGE